MTIREYAGAAKHTTLVGDITGASTSLTVADATGYPTGATGPFAIAIGLGLASEEKLLIASRSGNTLTVATGGRGYDGTSASSHASGSGLDHVLTATDLREANAFVNGGGVSTAGGSTITSATAATKGLVVKGAASQSAYLLEAQTSAGAVVLTVAPDGRLAAQSSTASGSAVYADAKVSGAFGLYGKSTHAAAQPLVVQGAASQTADLAQFQNSSGTVLAGVKAVGNLFVTTGALTLEVSAAAGGAVGGGAGSFLISLNGSIYKVPYFS